jgi:hypothetical protein
LSIPGRFLLPDKGSRGDLPVAVLHLGRLKNRVAAGWFFTLPDSMAN